MVGGITGQSLTGSVQTAHPLSTARPIHPTQSPPETQSVQATPTQVAPTLPT
jgi:hypothetical protein